MCLYGCFFLLITIFNSWNSGDTKLNSKHDRYPRDKIPVRVEPNQVIVFAYKDNRGQNTLFTNIRENWDLTRVIHYSIKQARPVRVEPNQAIVFA